MDELDELWQRIDATKKERPTTGRIHWAEMTQEMNNLYNTARGFYRLNQFDSALAFYRKAYQIAMKIGDGESQSKFKEMEGHCLRCLGRLRDALVCLVELEKLEGTPNCRWEGLIDQIVIATDIPISLRSIQSLMRRCSDEMERHGMQSSRCMLLIEESALASLQHDVSTALAKAQEAMHVYKKDANPNYNITVYYHHLINSYLDAGDHTSAKWWLEQYEDTATWLEFSKELDILSIRRRLALWDGDRPAAWDYAQRFLRKAREAEDSPYIGLINLVETGITCGRLTEIRQAMRELILRHRNSEEGHRRYAIRRLVGDYHRAIAQQSEPYTRENLRHTAIARRFYHYARKVGRFIDERLCCDWHEAEIERCLQSLEQ